MKVTFPLKVPRPEAIEVLSKKIGSCQVVKSRSNSDCIVEFVSALHNANNTSLVFCNKKNYKDIKEIVNATSSNIIVVLNKVPVPANKTLIVTDDPLGWFIKALNFLFNLDVNNPASELIISQETPVTPESTTIGRNTVIEESCVIGGNCTIGANCFIGRNVIIGNNVFIQNNTSIGGVGLGYHILDSGERLFFPHMGSVILGDDVVVGSNSVIVRGQLQDTIIGNKTRIGNLVNIGHNVIIKSECVISSNVCIAGGVSVGSACNIATGVVINAKKNIGNRCRIGLGSVVTKNLLDNMSVFGNPAKPLPTMRNF
jgi:UDP-3-O-[3-hydroxymyristoyl] glucosamine N-acyltransferase LpxD